MKRLKAALSRGEVLAGPLVSCPAPSIVELVGHAGFDWVLIDCEQSSLSPLGTELEAMLRAADAADIAAMVRVAENSEAQINKALNLGAQAVWVPHVETAAAAQAAVRACHYAPRGERGAAPIVRAARYGLESWGTYRTRADGETMLVAIVESVKGLEAIDEIAAVPGLDALCFGPFDMATDAGLAPEEFWGQNAGLHPFLDEAGCRVLDACRRYGKIAATAAWDTAIGRLWVERGYTLMLYGLDYAIFGKALQAHLKDIEAIKPNAQ